MTISEKTVAISIKTARLTAEVLQKAVKKLLDARKHKTPKEYKGKQTLKHLMKQNTGVSSMEITDAKEARTAAKTEKKPSIRAQLAQDKEALKNAPKKAAEKTKKQDLERS